MDLVMPRLDGLAAMRTLAPASLHLTADRPKLTQGAYRAMLDCLAQDPYNFQTQRNLGELLAKQEKWREARQHLEFGT